MIAIHENGYRIRLIGTLWRDSFNTMAQTNPAAERRREALKSFLEKNPDDSFSRYALALEYRSMGDMTAAIRELEELRKRDGNYIALYYQLGGLYAQEGQHENAREAYTAGISVARAANDMHTLSELQAALDELS